MLIKIFTAEHISDAGLMRSYLEQNGIPSQLRNEYCSSVIGELPFMTSSPEIWVDSSLARSAAKLITELDKADTGEQTQWRCSICAELSPANFYVCWNCQTEKA